MENRKSKILLICCILLLLLTFYLLNQNQKITQVQSTLSNFVTELQIKQDFYQTNFNLETEMTGIYAPDITCLESYNAKKLSEIIKGKPTLICIYKIECSSCEKNELNELQEIFQDHLESVYILCSHIIKRQIYVYAKEQKINIPILGISPDSFNWEAENNNKPYCFVLHPDMKISHVYFPSKEYSDLNKQYLKSVKRLFFEK